MKLFLRIFLDSCMKVRLIFMVISEEVTQADGARLNVEDMPPTEGNGTRRYEVDDNISIARGNLRYLVCVRVRSAVVELTTLGSVAAEYVRYKILLGLIEVG